MKKITFYFISVGALILSGCAGKEQIRQTLVNNPEILFEAIEKNPEKFMAAAQKASTQARMVAQTKAQEAEKAEREEQFKNPLKPEIGTDRAVRGNPKAPVTIVEYSDFECPYCRRGYNTVEEVRKKYGDKVRFVFKHLPLDFHPMALPAAKYFEAIALQSPEKAYKFHDEVFNNQSKLSSEKEKLLDRAAKKAGADMARLKKDLNSEKVMARIEADKKEAEKFGISGTPGFIVGGIKLAGAYPAPSFEEIIDRRLKEAGEGARDTASAHKPQ